MGFLKYTAFFVLIIVFFDATGQRNNQSAADEQLAAQLLAQGEFDKALVLYEELFTADPSPVIYNNYLRCLLETGDFRKAERVVNSQIRANPGIARFQVDLGYVFTRSGDARKARRQLEGLINDLSNHPSAITDLSNAFLFRDFVDYALQTLLKGRQMLGNSHPFNLQIASIYERRRDYEKMMSEYVELLILDETYTEQIQGIIQDDINDDPEFVKSDALRRVLLQGSQRNPSQTTYSELLLWLSVQQKDFNTAFMQARALDRRLRQDGKLVMDVARLSASNNQYAVARQSFSYIIDLGEINPYYLDAVIGLLNVKYNEATSGYEIDMQLLAEVEKEYEKALERLGLRVQTVSLLRNLANLKAFYLNKIDEAVELLQSVIELPNISSRIRGECRVELADIVLLRGDLWDAHLLYAQVDKTFRDDPLAHEARFKNARLSFYMGEFKWARAQLDVLKAATSRLIANDAMALSLFIQDNIEQDGTSIPLSMFGRAQMHSFMNKFDLALLVLDSIKLLYPSHRILDDVMMARATIYSRVGLYQEADHTLAEITRMFPFGLLAADALFTRARLHETVFRNQESAMELYQTLMLDYPGSLYASTARNRFRFLRGDIQNEEEFFYYNIFRP